MSEAETMQLFEQAFSEAVAKGASPDEIDHALERIQRRNDQIRITKGEGVDG